MSFIDEIEITVEAGKGGKGCVSFHREKFIAKGGPDGGDGGKGGDIYFIADHNLSSLTGFLSRNYFKAQDGQPGKNNKQHGSDGQDLHIKVPVGTLIIDSETKIIIGELNFDGQTIQVAKGGKGGLGNTHFASSTNQTPMYAQQGLPGEIKKIKLSLKLIADAGLVGFPNAGKSTILASLTKSNPRIADYPFTTLNPNLGVLFYQIDVFTERRLLLADIPGIIEGASKGIGLGISFLKHIERVKLILYVLDISSIRLAKEYLILRDELSQYSKTLLEKESMIIFNKIDLVDYDEEYILMIYEEFKNEIKRFQPTIEEIPVFFISAKEKKRLEDLKKKIFDYFPVSTFAEIFLKESYYENTN